MENCLLVSTSKKADRTLWLTVPYDYTYTTHQYV